MSRHVIDDAIAEIRRLREINEDLLETLKDVEDYLDEVHAPLLHKRVQASIRHAEEQQS